MRRRDFDPVYDRGQLLIDLAIAQLLGGEAISDFQGLRHLAPVIGPVPSTATVWRGRGGGGPPPPAPGAAAGGARPPAPRGLPAPPPPGGASLSRAPPPPGRR